MRRIGVYYISKHGQTRKIVDFLRRTFEKSGCLVTVVNLIDNPQAQLDETMHAVIIAAPVYAGGYSRKVQNFIRRNREALKRKDAAFCSVCLAYAPGTPESLDEAIDPIQSLLDSNQWSPKWIAVFAGALNYRDYLWPVKWIMKRKVRAAGGPTDTSRNYEFTSWDAVSRFAHEIAVNLPGGEFSTGQLLGSPKDHAYRTAS